MSPQGRGNRGRGDPFRGNPGGYGQGGGGSRGGGGGVDRAMRGRGGPSRGNPDGYGQGGGGRGGGDRVIRGRIGRYGGSDGRGRGGLIGRGGGRRGPARGGPGGGRDRGDFGIWQKNVPAVYNPRLREEADRVVTRFKAVTDDSPEYPLRMFPESDASARSHRFIAKALGGGHLAKPVWCGPTLLSYACPRSPSTITQSR